MRSTHVASSVLALLAVGGCAVVEPASDAPAPTRQRTVPPAEEVPVRPVAATALVALAALPVKGRAPLTGYDRDRFGPAWLDADRNGCDTRNDVLADTLRSVVLEANGCVVASGVHDDPYTGTRIDYRQGHGALVDVDHVVALGNAWATGAGGWSVLGRAAFANDPLNLLPADAGANRQKGDGDAATWLPPHRPFRCEYVARQVAVKAKYGLWVTPSEKAAVQRVLGRCPDQPTTTDRWHAPTAVDHDIDDPGLPGRSDGRAGEGFPSCDAAREAGAAPVRRGDEGYGSHLDGDGDGIACE